MPKSRHIVSLLAVCLVMAAVSASAEVLPIVGRTDAAFQAPIFSAPYQSYDQWAGFVGNPNAVDQDSIWINPHSLLLGIGAQLIYTEQTFNTQTAQPFVAGNLEFQSRYTVPGAILPMEIDFLFTTPSGAAEFTYMLNLVYNTETWNPLGGQETVMLLPTEFAPQSFIAGGYEYTVNMLGFYRNGQKVNFLSGGYWQQPDADLMARVDAVGAAVIPEPSSILLLATALAAAAGAEIRRRRVRA